MGKKPISNRIGYLEGKSARVLNLQENFDEYLRIAKGEYIVIPNEGYKEINRTMHDNFLKMRIDNNHLYLKSKVQIPKLVGKGRYELDVILGCGAFGRVYMGKELDTGFLVACKYESSTVRCPQLKNESRIYERLQGKQGIVEIFWRGSETVEGFDGHWLVMDMLGPSLEYLQKICGGFFSLKTVIMVGSQILSILEGLHRNKVVHRDIKTGNFCIGLEEKSNKIYIIDFGVAKICDDDSITKYQRNDIDKACTRTKENELSSINSHLGKGQCPADDLESLGYMLIYLLKGTLPWKKVKKLSISHEGKSHCLECKRDINLRDLCAECPLEFTKYMHYVKGLNCEETPNYRDLEKLFASCAVRNNISFDFLYDWITQGKQKEKSKGVFSTLKECMPCFK